MQSSRDMKSWLAASKGALLIMLPSEDMSSLEGAVRCVEELEKLCPKGGMLSSLCAVPQVLQYATDIRSALEAVTRGSMSESG